jgi:hypothetical protein
MVPQGRRLRLGVVRYVKERRSFGLIAVLLLLVLMTILVTTLLFLVGKDRTANSDYAEQVRAQEMAMSGVQTMIADLRQEMQAGSTVITPANGGQVWVPNAAQTMRVMPISNAPTAVNHLRASLPFVPSSIFPAAIYTGTLPPSRASSCSTTNYSQNEVAIPYPAFWDKAYLYPSTLSTAAKPPTPSWVFVQRSGVTTSALAWSTALKDKTASNSSYVLGRYAYQLYDIGGLVDLNVAGAPPTLTAAQKVSLEGTLAGVDLTQLGLTSQNISDLIQFRNGATTDYAGSITNALLATNGFMTTVPGDNRFFSRGDLIRYAQQDGFAVALPYLTYFSRDLNAPSWQPTYDAGGTYNYHSSASTTGATNRLIPGVTAAGGPQAYYNIAGTLLGTNLATGQPRIWKRFPLTKIAWLLDIVGGSDTTKIPAVLADFGLTWNATTGHWIYSVSGSSTPDTAILTLDSVPASRTPNFFELLKAGILSGSLGVPAGETQNAMLMTYNYSILSPSGIPLQDPNIDYHVMKIGACILDQYLVGAVPTAIDFDYAPSMPAAWKQGFEAPATGIKNIPYIYTLSQFASLNYPGSTPNTVNQQSWLEFELWNPHQTNNIPSLPNAVQIISGTATASADLQGTFETLTTDAQNNPTGDYNTHFASPGLASTGDRYIGFIPSTFTNYVAPRPFWTADSGPTSESASGDFITHPGLAMRRGFYLGSTNIATPTSFNEFYQAYGGAGIYSGPVNGLPLQLQANTGSGKPWISYQMVNMQSTPGQRISIPPQTIPPPFPATTLSYSIEGIADVTSDPRTTRGGWNYTSSAYGDGSYTPIATATADADGITRNNDIGTASPITGSIFNTMLERPIILNRQFHTPGDLGYAFRDQPWRSLDFRSTNSADAGLLDIFSIYDDPPITAGHINLNSAPGPVVAAIVSGSTKNEISGTTFSGADAATIAGAFTNWVATTPMQSRGELASFASTNSITGVITNNRKFEREGAIRALSGVGQTRTINLLLDIVAQAGLYGPSAASLNDFHVTAQVHYWAHIAIDRFTGQIIDLKLEPVYE